jgi:hypothetical protein
MGDEMNTALVIVNGIICLVVLVALPASIYDTVRRIYRIIKKRPVSPTIVLLKVWGRYGLFTLIGMAILYGVSLPMYVSHDPRGAFVYMNPMGFILSVLFLSYVWVRQRRDTWGPIRNPGLADNDNAELDRNSTDSEGNV